jgi:arginine metabolism regulation protein II
MPLGKKSPWKILNVPAAMVTYSDLTILGSRNVNHARQANLYGLLACSAVHLSMYPSASSSDTAQHWQETAENMFELARENMQMSIKYETQEPKTAKYKDQLMAICCLTEYAVGSITSNVICSPPEGQRLTCLDLIWATALRSWVPYPR